jgi:hypothetical protein
MFFNRQYGTKNRLYNISITKCIKFGIIADQTGQNWFDCQLAWFELSIPLLLRFVSTQFKNVGRFRIISRNHPSRRIYQHVSLSEQHNIIVSYATKYSIVSTRRMQFNRIWLIDCLLPNVQRHIFHGRVEGYDWIYTLLTYSYGFDCLLMLTMFYFSLQMTMVIVQH